jgi:hypothetical protein
MPSERRLINVLESQINESDVSNSEVGEQRQRNHRYYSLQPLGNEQKGRSQYISPDVLDSVEDKKSLFAETFLSGRRVVKFTANDEGDKLEADKRTAYVEEVFNRNRMYDLMRDSWHDAFVAKRCVFLVEWRDKKRATWTCRAPHRSRRICLPSSRGRSWDSMTAV